MWTLGEGSVAGVNSSSLCPWLCAQIPPVYPSGMRMFRRLPTTCVPYASVCRNCLREVVGTIDQQKPYLFVQEADVAKGGGTIDDLMKELIDVEHRVSAVVFEPAPPRPCAGQRKLTQHGPRPQGAGHSGPAGSNTYRSNPIPIDRIPSPSHRIAFLAGNSLRRPQGHRLAPNRGLSDNLAPRDRGENAARLKLCEGAGKLTTCYWLTAYYSLLTTYYLLLTTAYF